MLPGDPIEEPDKNPLGQGLFHETLAPQCRGIHQYSLDCHRNGGTVKPGSHMLLTYLRHRNSTAWDTVTPYVNICHRIIICPRHWPPAFLQSWAEFNFACKSAVGSSCLWWNYFYVNFICGSWLQNVRCNNFSRNSLLSKWQMVKRPRVRSYEVNHILMDKISKYQAIQKHIKYIKILPWT